MRQRLFKVIHPTLYLPCVVAFHNDCSFAGPHHRGVAKRCGIVVQNKTVNEGILKHLEGGEGLKSGTFLLTTAVISINILP